MTPVWVGTCDSDLTNVRLEWRPDEGILITVQEKRYYFTAELSDDSLEVYWVSDECNSVDGAKACAVKMFRQHLSKTQGRATPLPTPVWKLMPEACGHLAHDDEDEDEGISRSEGEGPCWQEWCVEDGLYVRVEFADDLGHYTAAVVDDRGPETECERSSVVASIREARVLGIEMLKEYLASLVTQ